MRPIFAADIAADEQVRLGEQALEAKEAQIVALLKEQEALPLRWERLRRGLGSGAKTDEEVLELGPSAGGQEHAGQGGHETWGHSSSAGRS